MKIILFSLLATAVLSLPVQAKTIVTPETFARADVDLTLSNVVKEVGSNKFRHDRSLIPLDKQPAVTMNRDTIYSLGVSTSPRVQRSLCRSRRTAATSRR
jgi:hypothetical protein